MLISYVLRHKISDEGTADLLNMINTIDPGKVPRSKYLMKKDFGADVSEPEEHFYGLYCKGYLGQETCERQVCCEN